MIIDPAEPNKLALKTISTAKKDIEILAVRTRKRNGSLDTR
jgi:hypothetical protein